MFEVSLLIYINIPWIVWDWTWCLSLRHPVRCILFRTFLHRRAQKALWGKGRWLLAIPLLRISPRALMLTYADLLQFDALRFCSHPLEVKPHSTDFLVGLYIFNFWDLCGFQLTKLDINWEMWWRVISQLDSHPSSFCLTCIQTSSWKLPFECRDQTRLT